MTDFSVYTQNAFLDWIAGSSNMPAAVTPYVALFNGDPFEGGTEVTSTVDSTGRKSVTLGSTANYTVGRYKTNTSDVDFGTADAGTTADYAAIYDAAIGGNLLCRAQLSGNSTIVAGQVIRFSVGTLVIRTQGDTA